MDLASIRMVTDDLERTVQFYEQLTGVAAVRYTPVFAELIMPSCTLAIGQTQTTQLFGTDSARPHNPTVIIEFRVEDVDSEYQRLSRWSPNGFRGPPRCPGATAPSCSATPTATSSTSSRRSPQKPSRSAAANRERGARPPPGRSTTRTRPARRDACHPRLRQTGRPPRLIALSRHLSPLAACNRSQQAFSRAGSNSATRGPAFVRRRASGRAQAEPCFARTPGDVVLAQLGRRPWGRLPTAIA